MSGVVYGMCAALSLLCAGVLWQAFQRSRSPLLLWSALFFLLSSGADLFLVFDKLVVTQDLSPYRFSAGLLAISVLLYGLIWNTE